MFPQASAWGVQCEQEKLDMLGFTLKWPVFGRAPATAACAAAARRIPCTTSGSRSTSLASKKLSPCHARRGGGFPEIANLKWPPPAENDLWIAFDDFCRKSILARENPPVLTRSSLPFSLRSRTRQQDGYQAAHQDDRGQRPRRDQGAHPVPHLSPRQKKPKSRACL